MIAHLSYSALQEDCQGGVIYQVLGGHAACPVCSAGFFVLFS